MSTMADKLESAKIALQYCVDTHPASGIVRGALAEFPDPDAVGRLVELSDHDVGCPREVGVCRCGYNMALAKLEEKT